jgi:hypothetical protein
MGPARILMVCSVLGCAQIVDLGPRREHTEGQGGAGGDGTGAGGSGGDDVAPPCSGSIVWALQLGDQAQQVSGGAASDGAGGVFIAGYFSGYLDIGGNQLKSYAGSDMFLAHFDGEGRPLFGLSFSDTTSQTGRYEVAPDGHGGVVIAGAILGSVDFGGGPLTAYGDEADAFVARFDATGKHLWSKSFGGPSPQGVRAMAVNPASGDIVLGGFHHESISFGGEMFTTLPTMANAFIAKLSPNGDHLWSHSFGGDPTGEYTNAVAVDPSGMVAFGGSSNVDLDLGDGALMHSPDDLDADAWLALYSDDGEPIWTTMYADPGFEDMRRISFGPKGDVVIAGKVRGSINLGGGPVSASEGIFVARLNPSGTHRASRAINGIFDPRGLSVDPLYDNVIVAGGFATAFEPESVPIVSVGKLDGVAVRLDPLLAQPESIIFGSKQDDDMTAATFSSDGSAFAFGTFQELITLPGCGTLHSVGETDLLLLKLAP